MYIVPQNVYEFWVVATRPRANNGFGPIVPDCVGMLAKVSHVFPLLPDPPSRSAEWRTLVEAHDCKGKVAHDARLVAAMRGHKLADLLTFNTADFQRFARLNLLNPAAVAP